MSTVTIEIRPPAESELRAAMEAAESAFGSGAAEAATLLFRTDLPPSCPEVF